MDEQVCESVFCWSRIYTDVTKSYNYQNNPQPPTRWLNYLFLGPGSAGGREVYLSGIESSDALGMLPKNWRAG